MTGEELAFLKERGYGKHLLCLPIVLKEPFSFLFNQIDYTQTPNLCKTIKTEKA